ncbi:hypothetical protein [[Acholeplasma] multilocale]|uniref:hypothetical protein n=1 Tax=[Acholeplasma] multilocale TaxID=264638 RepID=UPI00047D4FB6|nr:hypothetical protein [[Acholeplasma] multilocale]
MDKQNNVQEEVELGFFEPSLGLIITNLEFLEEELAQEKIDVKALTNLIDEFNEIEDLEQWNGLVNKLDEMSQGLIENILKIVDADHFKLLSYLFLALTLAKHLKEDEKLMQFAIELEEKIANKELVNNDEVIIVEYKGLVVNLVNELYAHIQERITDETPVSDEFKKVVKILAKEKELADLRDGTEVLMDLYVVEHEINNESKETVLLQFQTLNEINGLITLIDFWEQDNLEEE